MAKQMTRKQLETVQDGIMTVLLTVICLCIVLAAMWASKVVFI